MRIRIIGTFLACAAYAFAGAGPAAATTRDRLPDGAPAWLRPAPGHLARALPPVPASRSRARSAFAFRNTGQAAYSIVAIGTPAAGLSAPTPYAVDQYGNVALQYECLTSQCGTNGLFTYAYLWSPATHAFIRLAGFASSAVVGYTPYAMTPSGTEIVGWVTLRSAAGSNGFLDRPCVWMRTGPTTSTIAFLDSGEATVEAEAYGISHSGNHIVGFTTVNGEPQAVAFSLTGNAAISNYPNSSEAFSVNDAGVAAGEFYGEAALFVNGKLETFYLQNASGLAQADSIAENGETIGYYDDVYYGGAPADYEFGFFYIPPSPGAGITASGELGQINVGNAETFPMAVNDVGNFVGVVEGGGLENTAPGPFLDQTFLRDLLPPSTTLMPATATAINDSNVIVGETITNGVVGAYEMFPSTAGGCTQTPHTPSCL